METMNHLKDLLMYDVQHLYSVESQIIEALPSMIDKASNHALKGALEEHLQVTERQKDRLDKVKQMIGEANDAGKNTGIFANLFSAAGKSKGIEGLIEESDKLMTVDMEPQVMDAAIIGAVQKVEHYEIAAYGTARTYAEQLGMVEAAQLLQQTLIEEHDMDDQLSSLAKDNVNQRAVVGVDVSS